MNHAAHSRVLGTASGAAKALEAEKMDTDTRSADFEEAAATTVAKGDEKIPTEPTALADDLNAHYVPLNVASEEEQLRITETFTEVRDFAAPAVNPNEVNFPGQAHSEVVAPITTSIASTLRRGNRATGHFFGR